MGARGSRAVSAFGTEQPSEKAQQGPRGTYRHGGQPHLTHSHLPTFPAGKRIATEAHSSFVCAARGANQLSGGDYSVASGTASPGKMGTLTLKAAPSGVADGTALLRMEGALGSKLGMELSAKH